MSRIALIGPKDRPEIGRLAIRLEERGAEPVFLDSRPDPAIVIAPDRIEACGQDLGTVRGAYVADLGIRSPGAPVVGADPAAPAGPRYSLAASLRHLAAWNALLEKLAERGPVVNPPVTHDLHSLKPLEISVYARSGLPVPHTVATNDPAELRDLPGGGSGGWVVKGMVGGYTHTEIVEAPGSADAARALLGEGPRMVQGRIEGDNVRAFVLDGAVVGAAEVVSTEGEEVDSRRGETRIRRIEIPEAAARSAVSVAARWGMPFAAVDFMRDARTGEFQILECNSAPFFVVFEGRAGIDLSGKLADFLLGR